MNVNPALRLTPSNSPFLKTSVNRSPTKAVVKAEEPGLHLKKVIGTTTASANGFDCLPSARQFAFTAGAAAVLATVDKDLNIQQQFFRANPASSANRDANTNWPVTASPGDRGRTLGYFKDQSGGASPLSASLRDWSDSPSGRSATAKDRVKAATSVSLSPNGKWLAVGETGYRPRILIFSARDGSSELPVAVVAEHTFGVHALSFSPDSRYLASLGTVNDGFLYIWNVDDRTGVPILFASNKCTTTIHCMSWVGRSLVTVGLRFVKVWRPDEEATLDSRGSDTVRSTTPRPKIELRSDFGNSILSPKHKVLAGKNSLLGEMLEATFISVIATSDCKALICAEGGEVCLLDDSDRMQTLTFATTTGIRITAAMIDGGALRVVGADDSGCRRTSNILPRSMLVKGTTIVATATVGDIVIMIDSNRMISLSKAGSDTDNDDEILHRHLTAHDDAVLGVRPFHSKILPTAAFFTFSGNGAMRFWDDEGCAVGGLTAPVESSPDMYGQSNELRAAVSSENGDYIATGDKFGSMALFSTFDSNMLQQVRAHSTEIMDIASFVRGGIQFFASASRDRTVQLFACTNKRLELLQTMDEHAASVNCVLPARDGDQLLSCSSDRSVVVREAVLRDPDNPRSLAFGMLRTISLKSSPLSMCLTPEDNMVLVSAVDRCISKYNTKTGQADFSFKCSDNDNGEAAVMSKIIYAPSLNGNPTIAGVSSSDKSVRLYTEYGSLIARDWGHTEGITDIAFISPPRREGNREYRSPHIATVAADSTIFMWESVLPNNRSTTALSSDSGSGEVTETAPAATLKPPLRKVISYSEISRFRRERAADENEPPSPNALSTSPSTVSPPKLRKKSSRPSFAQAPRLEPAFRSTFRETSRRRSNRHRNATGFGSLTASTDSVCRTLRAYRKKLSNSSANETISNEIIRELEKELKLTARVVGEKSAGKTLDEAIMTKLLEQASDKIIGMLDEKIKERVQGRARVVSGGAAVPSATASILESPAEIEEVIHRSETTPPGL
ncbi:WD40 repeat-like protein [Dissoconium aciculare CBS 342.82]|uniref:WD40 repeat-like protein n=1 Tax=Dissoconium aciculare CBS 342.82 TaxID=1314786 RepID=A0A6J3ME41_9PEZI|nr:WD40 repeat-like protein [Dissoconium aciculare CBS 342.82]KAF1826275.1 WD40 repeat-like protein [Dissoconium aciculare CBS 342.82]